MPLLIKERAVVRSPLRLLTSAEARSRRIVVDDSWHRVRRGIYVLRERYGALASWQRYHVRVLAFADAHPEQILCLESAAVVHGLPLFGETADIHVFSTERTASRRFGDVSVHTSADGREVVRLDGIRTTGMLDTVVDLLRVLPPAQALAVLDTAISRVQGGALALDEVVGLTATQQSRRGAARLRWLTANADGASESPGESVSRAVIAWCGYETPEIQRRFTYEGHDDRVDFHFPSTGTIGESDGWGKYRLDDPATAARMLEREKRREDRLRRHGHPFARWDLAGAFRVEPIRAALDAASVPRVRPAQREFLATLHHRPREKKREKPGRR
ncbi:hypothetical protein ACWGJP_09155 [Microbacterium sp. NPDC055903]